MKILTLLLSLVGLFLFYQNWKKHKGNDSYEEGQSVYESETTSSAAVSKRPQKVDTRQVMERNSGTPTFNQNLRLVEDEEVKDLSFQEMEAIEELFDQVEENWAKTMRDLFVSELGLGEEAFKKYQEMRDEYDVAKLQAYEAYHERMIEQHGPDYPYQASIQVEEFDNSALPEFYKRLEAQIGLEALRRYIQVKDQFNDELRRTQPPGPAQILIDF